MLVQSHNGVIRLLPALPDAWPEGQATGLRARGGYELDIAWKNGKLTGATLRSKLGGSCKIRYSQKMIEINTRPTSTHQIADLLTSN